MCKFFSRDHEDLYGGVLIAIKSEFQCSLVYKSITSELLSIKLHQIKSATIIISASYCPLSCASTESARCVVEELHDICINHPIHEVLICGDFYLPGIDWNNLKCKNA